jgi:hypothetical protein
MPDRRIGPWSTSGVVGWCTGVATIGGAFAGFIAAQAKGSPWHQPLFDLLTAIAAIAFLLLIAAGVAALITWASPAFRRPARLITDRWQATTDGIRAPAPALAMEIALPGTSYMRQPGDRPPWVRFVAHIACGPVGGDPDWPAIRAAFGAFLQRPAVAELLADLTRAGQDAAWARQATSTSSIIDMVLGDGVASARLELPDGIRRMAGSRAMRCSSSMSSRATRTARPHRPQARPRGGGSSSGPCSSRARSRRCCPASSGSQFLVSRPRRRESGWKLPAT